MNVFELFMSTIAFFALPSKPLVIALLFLIIPSFLIGGSALFVLGDDVWFRWQLQRRGIVVEGQVMKREQRRAYTKAMIDYTLICRYIYNGQTYSERFFVSSLDFGRNVQLRLLPDRPKKASVIESDSCFTIAYRVIKMGLLAFLGISLMVMGVWLVVSFLSLPTP